MDATKVFIESTAKDYDMDVDDVRRVAKISRDGCEFYAKLEAFIALRATE